MSIQSLNGFFFNSHESLISKYFLVDRHVFYHSWVFDLQNIFLGDTSCFFISAVYLGQITMLIKNCLALFWGWGAFNQRTFVTTNWFKKETIINTKAIQFFVHFVIWQKSIPILHTHVIHMKSPILLFCFCWFFPQKYATFENIFAHNTTTERIRDQILQITSLVILYFQVSISQKPLKKKAHSRKKP